MKSFYKTILLLILLLPYYAAATWYTAEGKAEIINSEVEAARKAAVENALRNALFQAGTTVSGISELSQGVLQSDQFSVRARGEVRNVHLVRERREGDFITISLKADIMSMQDCVQDYYRKSVLIGPFSLLKRQQAQLGSIYRIEAELTKVLHNRLGTNSSNINVRNLLLSNIRIPRQPNAQGMRSVAARLSEKYNAQFVVLGVIKDISYFDADVPGLLDFGQKETRRNFSVELFLFDGVKGELVLLKSYNGHEKWSLHNTQKVDVSGQVFWRSEYGQFIQNTMYEMANDVDQIVACRKSAGQITRVLDDAVVINLGRKNGLKIGDEFRLVHTQSDDNGDTTLQFFSRKDNTRFSVAALQGERAIVKPRHVSDLANVQIRDLLEPADSF